jgi:aryl-phospho-beta-D-glucosidase BglC (GH1 family)
METLQVNKGQIVTTAGQPVRLCGYNIGGWLNLEDFIDGYVGAEHSLRRTMGRVLGREKAQFFFDRLLDYFFTEADVAAMAALGANVLRIPFNYRHFERDDRPFEYLEPGFQRLDAAMNWCAQHGLYVILDFHATPGWHNPDWHSDNAHVHIMLYEHKLFQDRFVGLWEKMATRYKDHPALVGYDLMNEPLTCMHYEQYEAACYDWQALNALYHRAAAAIRAIDSQHLLFVEGDNFATEFDGLDVSFDENLVVSTHNYIAATGGGLPYPGEIDGIYWNRDIVAAEFGMHSGTRMAVQQRKPILVGEFGVWYAGYPEALPYRAAALDDQLSVFDSAGVHWTIWTWKDIASMGSYNLDPESSYVRTIAPILKAKQQAADWEGEMPQGVVAQAMKAAADAVDGCLEEAGLAVRISRRWFGHFSLFAYLAQFLQVPYAHRFADKSETEIDEMLQAFQFDRCQPNEAILGAVRAHLPPRVRSA